VQAIQVKKSAGEVRPTPAQTMENQKMLQSVPLAMIPYKGIVVLPQHSERRQRAEAKIAATSRPISSPGIIHLPERVGLRALPPPKTVIEYGNAMLAQLPAPMRGQVQSAIDRLLDRSLRFLLGIDESADFEVSRGYFANSIREIKKGKSADLTPRTKLREAPIWMAGEVPDLEADAGRRLGIVLANFLDMDVHPKTGLFDQGEYRYVLKKWYGHDGLVVTRKSPGGRSYLIGRLCLCRDEVKFVMAELDAEYNAQNRPITERFDVTLETIDETITDVIKERTDRRMQGYIGGASQRANVAAQNALPRRDNPFKPSTPILAGGAS
jgi:hypothetical protein